MMRIPSQLFASALLLLIGSCELRPAQSPHEPPGPRDLALPVDAAKPADLAPVIIPDLAPAIPDVEPASYGTAAASVAALPWACANSGRGVPQANDIEWWGNTNGPPIPADVKLPNDLRDALLACTFEATGCFDRILSSDCSPDLDVTLRLPHAPAMSLWNGSDRSSGYISAPLVQLRSGESLSLSAVDMDLWGHDNVGSVSLRYNGHSWMRGRRGALKLECLLSTREQIEPWLRKALAALDAKMRQLTVTVSESEFDLGLSATGLPAARQEACNLAGVVGWVEPRFNRRLSELIQKAHDWEQALQKKMEALAPTAGEPATIVDGYKVRKGSLSCKNEPGGHWPQIACSLKLIATTDEPRKLTRDDRPAEKLGLTKVEFFTREGKKIEAAFPRAFFVSAPQKDIARQEVEWTPEKPLLFTYTFRERTSDAYYLYQQPAWVRFGKVMLKLF